MPSCPTDEVVDVLRQLAADLRSGSTLDRALAACDSVPLIPARRSIALGEPPERALGVLEHPGLDGLADRLDVCHRVGGDIATVLECTAASIEEGSNQDDRARSFAAGAKASAKVIAALPFVSMAVLVWSGISPLSGAGAITAPLGAILAVTGLRWMSTLIPTWSDADHSAQLAETLALATRAGIGLHPALSMAARSASQPTLVDARRRVAIGFTWTEALAASDDAAFRQLARQIERSAATGAPIADALDSWAYERRARSRRDFEARIRRAPVRMALPLTLCVLPAFILLGIVPFFHGVSLHP